MRIDHNRDGSAILQTEGVALLHQFHTLGQTQVGLNVPTVGGRVAHSVHLDHVVGHNPRGGVGDMRQSSGGEVVVIISSSCAIAPHEEKGMVFTLVHVGYTATQTGEEGVDLLPASVRFLIEEVTDWGAMTGAKDTQ